MIRLKKWISQLLRAFLVVVCFFFLLEVAFRFYWVDFYTAEFKALNLTSKLEKRDGPTVLIGGDSFTGAQNSYVQILREERPQAQIINVGIPGTGIAESACFLPDRIAEWQPDVFIYQIYVGNDLLDIRHPIDSPKIGWARKWYWWFADRIRSARYINYKLAQFRYNFTDEVGNANTTVNEEFSVRNYSAREKMNLAAEPALIYNSAYLEGGRKEDFNHMVQALQKILKSVPTNCKKYVLVIPHCAQVEEHYWRNMEILGAEFPNDSGILETSYPFVLEIDSALAADSLATVLDPQQFLSELETKGVAVYYPDDPHLTTVGQQKLGQWMLKIIPENF